MRNTYHEAPPHAVFLQPSVTSSCLNQVFFSAPRSLTPSTCTFLILREIKGLTRTKQQESKTILNWMALSIPWIQPAPTIFVNAVLIFWPKYFGFVTISKSLLAVWSQESVISVVNRLRVVRPRNPGLIPDRGNGVFSSLERLGRFWGLTWPPIQSALGALSPRLKRPGR
jgi:hypothetical protein